MEILGMLERPKDRKSFQGLEGIDKLLHELNLNLVHGGKAVPILSDTPRRHEPSKRSQQHCSPKAKA